MGGDACQSCELVDGSHLVFWLICLVNLLAVFAAVRNDSFFCSDETSSATLCFLLSTEKWTLSACVRRRDAMEKNQLMRGRNLVECP